MRHKNVLIPFALNPAIRLRTGLSKGKRVSALRTSFVPDQERGRNSEYDAHCFAGELLMNLPRPNMRHIRQLLKASLLTLALSLAVPAAAQDAQDAQARCAQAHDPENCLARLQAKAACRQERGRELQQCLYDHMPPADCSKVQDSARCALRQQAVKACHDKIGKERRACLLEHGLH